MMKFSKTQAMLASVMALAAIGAVETRAAAQATVSVAAGAQSKLWIDGTSNLHGWTCKAESLEAAIDLDSAAATQLNSAPPKALKRVTVKVPVKSLKCGHGGMDDNLYKALHADDSPAISYILATFESAPGATKDSFTLHTVGTLTVSGKENNVAMDVTATRAPDGTVTASGTLPIKMTDYGIKPPTAIFGTLHTGDEVKISFELTLRANTIATALGLP